MSYPTDLDSFTDPTSSDTLASVPHAQQHQSLNAAVEALEAKVGITASTPSAGKVLKSTGNGVSAWAAVDLTTDVTGSLPLANGGTAGTSAATARANLSVYSQAQVDAIKEGLWPVGSIYIAVVSTDPATLLGFGTWAAFGAGRVLVGLNSADTDFDTAEETGGAKTHSHTTDVATNSQSTSNSGPTSANHTHAGVTTGAGNSSGMSADHTHNIAHTHNVPAGGSASSMPPYIVVYMWKRTA